MPKQYTIAIVDDDEIYRYTIVKTIESLQLSKKTRVFENGSTALRFMLDHIEKPDSLPDVILLDVNMPIMDGFEFMKAYVDFPDEIKKNITVFMISSSINPRDIEAAKNIAEISDYIVKPIGAVKLQRIISEMEENNGL